MGVKEIIKQAFLEGYATSNITVKTVFICLICTVIVAAYIYVVYRTLNKNTFYNRNFNLSLMALAIITSAIILTVQSNIVVSLGMVGALSIVRFRTAIKDPMDLVFLFWSISAGIICGAGFALIAIVASLLITIVILVVSSKPVAKGTLLLVVNASSYQNEKELLEIVQGNCKYSKVRSRNASRSGLNLAVEVIAGDPSALLASLLEKECVVNASLVEHDGNITV